jgi:heat shock protein HslJ
MGRKIGAGNCRGNGLSISNFYTLGIVGLYFFIDPKQFMAKELIYVCRITNTIMRGLITILLTILLLAMMSCKSTKITENQAIEEKIFWVNSSKFPCMGVGPMTCLQVQENEEIEEGKWSFFYSYIEGFEYEPGNIYRIKVKVSKVKEPVPADASSLNYQLIEIMEKYPDMTLRLTNIWLVKEIGETLNPKGHNRDLTFEIHVAERKISGYSGCNTLRAPISKITETEIKFGNMASTKMACGEEEMQLERKITQALEEVVYYQFKDKYLVFMDSEKTVLMKLMNVD